MSNGLSQALPPWGARARRRTSPTSPSSWPRKLQATSRAPRLWWMAGSFSPEALICLGKYFQIIERGLNMTKVSIVQTKDRAAGVNRALELLHLNPVKGKEVVLKPNFNS